MQITVTTMTSTTTTASTKRKYEVDGRCMACQFDSFERLMTKYKFSYRDRQDFFEFYNLTIGRGAGKPMPEIHRELNMKFKELSRISDPYLEEKFASNKLALSLYKKWRIRVIKSDDYFDSALRLSIAGNIMDYGPSNDFDVEKTIEQVKSAKFAIDDSKLLKQRIKEAKSILYLGDNAGEIVFDKLFIEMLMHPHLTYAVRGGAVLNDVTIEDAEEVGMEIVADVISNGYDSASTILDKCSEEFIEIYNKADLIISKGQGNLEGLINENDARIFFLLMVKCDVVAEKLSIDKGSFVVYNQKNGF